MTRIPIFTAALGFALCGAVWPADAQQAQPQIQPQALQQLQIQPQPRPQPSPGAPTTAAIDWNQAAIDARTQGQSQNQTFAAAPPPSPVRPTNASGAQMNAMRLPVLSPSAAALNLPGAQSLIFPRGDFYTISISGDGLTIEVFGTRLAHAVAPPVSARHLRAANAEGFRVSEGEGNREISFNRYGAAYSVTVECEDVDDARCGDAAYVTRLARSLTIIGGRPGEGDAP